MTETQKLRLVIAQPGQRIARLRPHHETLEADGSRTFTSGGPHRPNGVTADVNLVIAWAFRPDDNELVPMPVTISGILQRTEMDVLSLWDNMWQNPEGFATTLRECKDYALTIAQEEFDREAEKSRLTSE